MFRLQVSRRLHEEHSQAAGMLARLQAYFVRQGPARPPLPNDAEFSALARGLAAAVAGEIASHFRFEEEELFPALAARGEADIGVLLTEEHRVILPLAQRVIVLARAQTTTSEQWAELHRCGGELVERLTSHIEKEEMGLVPLIEELLDDEADARLAEAYAALG
jgi:hemerythrin-like domain-containing protein